MQASARARARITEGAKLCFYRLLIKLFFFCFCSYLLLMCGWGWRGSGVVAAAAGSAVICGGGLISDSLKKRERKLLQNSHCLLKQTVWRLSVGWNCFLAIKRGKSILFNIQS